MVLVQNWSFLHVFILGNRGQENVFYDILERKKVFLCCKNKKFKKLRNWDFSKAVSPWFWFKIGHFCMFLFSAIIIGQENMFYDIVKQKNVFLACKNKKFKKSKNWDFSKGVSHGFGPKKAIFEFFCFRRNRPGKCVLWYSRTKKCLSML